MILKFCLLKDEPFFQVQYDEGLRMAKILKLLEYIGYIKIKRSRPSSGSLHEKKCILLSVMIML